ncbi:MAG: sigma-70 family RNA polymerase sigma factor [Myxococcota bacterium]|nr:sigma-70 family RNA polymerase sigma factor [Myxococcota bacterium]
MSQSFTILKANVNASVTSNDDEEASALLEARLAEAKWVWPDIEGQTEDFVIYLAERLPDGSEINETLRRMKVSDLYLAWGCVTGDDAALTAFGQHFDEMVSAAVRRFARQGLDVDDAKQKVLEFILFPTAKRAAAIGLYAGHGSLKGYLGVSVVREILRMLKAAKKAPAMDMQDPSNSIADSDDDPELVLLKRKYRTEFKSAFQDAFQVLNAEDRNLLRYYYVTDLTLVQIAAITGVKHNTISRRLAKVRSTLLSETRERLIMKAGIPESEFQSIVRLVQSQLQVSMYRMLDKPAKPKDD